MTSLRLLALAAGAAGLAVAGTAGILPTQRAPGSADRPARASSAAFTSPSTATTTSTTTSTSRATPDLRDVPASILSRAAAARALDREAGAACRSLARSDATCAPQRDTVEIRWDVGKDP